MSLLIHLSEVIKCCVLFYFILFYYYWKHLSPNYRPCTDTKISYKFIKHLLNKKVFVFDKHPKHLFLFNWKQKKKRKRKQKKNIWYSETVKGLNDQFIKILYFLSYFISYYYIFIFISYKYINYCKLTIKFSRAIVFVNLKKRKRKMRGSNIIKAILSILLILRLIFEYHPHK